ncbi:MAG: ribonuclease P protein component [Coleofasciculaceae cyanobacterium SM2_1_6]|nr:ribonuclease P protein component [Coleofasciculaceae cyanobacterium SM2_1_6]
MALAKVHRLRHWRDFQVAYQQGKRYSGNFFTLFKLKQFSPKNKYQDKSPNKFPDKSPDKPQNRHLPNLPASPIAKSLDSLGEKSREKPTEEILLPTKIGVSISQKVSKKAVVRNRLKRQILAIYQNLLPQIVPGFRLVIVVKPRAVGCNYEDFLRELRQLLTQAQVI